MALAGLVVSFHEIEATERKELSNLVKENGGTVTYILGPLVTHLVTNKQTIDANGFKIQSAKKNETQVVLPQFIYDLIDSYVPEEVTEEEAQISSGQGISQSAGTLTIYKPTSSTSYREDVSVTNVLPNISNVGSVIKVSVFGNNFKPNETLRIKFGDYVCSDIEFHCSSVVIATVYSDGLRPGQVLVTASNDGKQFGTGVNFTFTDNTEDAEIKAWHQQELKELRKKIFQLQNDLLEVQKMELNLSNKFYDQLGLPLPPAKVKTLLPKPEPKELTQVVTFQTEPKVVSPKPSISSPARQKAYSIATAAAAKRKQLTSRGAKSTPLNATPEAAAVDEMAREVKIFISSPFKDMNDERDLIIKNIVPKLRKLCLERDIVMTIVDLRWGVTSAQQQGAATMLMCLREIERSNIFLGLYGERYGWCLSEHSFRKPTSQDELLQRTFAIASNQFPWINNFKDRSVTEIEMRMVMDGFSKGKQAFFYLRDPYYIENIPADKKNDYLSEGEYEHAKLVALKQDIARSSFLSTQYTRPSHMSELLLQHLTEHLNKTYPQGTQLSPFLRERFLHATFARSLTRVYLPNEKYYLELDKYAASNITMPMIVKGQSGIGKSAVLANWIKRYKSHHPEVVVIEHWIGSTASSNNYLNILRRIMDEIQNFLKDSTDDIPTESKELEKVFAQWLEKTLTRNQLNKVVIIIDGLDNLDDSGNAHTLLWLPQQFPICARIVLSMSDSRPLEMCNKRGYPVLEINPLEEGERASFIRQYLDTHSKKLTEQQEFKIARCKQAENPRYLKTLLEDLSIFGNFDDLNTKIDHDLKAANCSELYEIVLERIEKDLDPKKLRLFLGYIWNSRRGLFLDTELGVILEKLHNIDYNTWQAIYMGTEDLLLSSGGRIILANGDIYKAVEHRYFSDPQVKKQFHSELAEFFSKSVEGFTERKVDELAWNLYYAEEWEKLQVCISNLSMFNKLYTAVSKVDLNRYWRALEKKFDIVECYISALERGDTLPAEVLKGDLTYQVARFLIEMAKYEGAEKIFVKARNLYNVGSQNLEVAKVDYAIAGVKLRQANYADAEELLEKCLRIYIRERSEDDLHVASVLNRLGALYLEINKFEKSEDCFRKALRIRRSKLGASSWKVARTLLLIVKFYERMEKYDEAVDNCKQAIKIAEEEFGPDDLFLTQFLVALGRIYMTQKKFDEAKVLYKRALKIAEEKVGNDHPKTGEIVYELGCFFFIKPEEITRAKHSNIAKIQNKNYWANINYSQVQLVHKKTTQAEEAKSKKGWTRDRAEKLFLRALTIYQSTLGKDHPDGARILNRLGSLYIERVQYDQAEQYLTEALEILVNKLGPLHSRVAQSYKHMFTLYELQEKFNEAKQAGLEAIKVLSHIYGEMSVPVAHVYVRLGSQAVEQRDRESATSFFKKAREIRIFLFRTKSQRC